MRFARRMDSACRGLLVLLALVASPAQAQPGEDWGSFGIQTQWMDETVEPGDDFYRFVNGDWLASTEIPDDKTRIGAFITLRDLSEERLHGILEDLANSQQPETLDEQRIAAAYRAFMDEDAIEAAGLAPAWPYLSRIYSIETLDDLVKVFATPGFASPLGLGVDSDAKQSDIYALYLGQAGLGMPDRDYYLVDNKTNETIRAEYKKLLGLLLGEAGYADPQSAADAVYALEHRLAGEMWDRTIRRNRDLTYNKLSREEIDALGPRNLLGAFVDAAGAKGVSTAIVVQMPPTEEELAEAGLDADETGSKLGGGMPATLSLIEKVPLATWKAYLAAHFLSDHAAYLPKEIDNANFAFYGTSLAGQPKQKARWKRGISAVEGQIGELLGKIYAERYYPPEERAAMEDLVANLRKAMAANLEELSWMSAETRLEARKKLDAFTPKIGAPASYKSYEGLAISPDDALANSMAAAVWETDFSMKRIGKPVDKSEWFMFPQTVNAYYNPSFNEVVFPAAILQPPFFNVSADPAVNYGAIGAVIGHEIGHGFDDQGSKADGDGNLRNWWTDEDKKRFEVLQAKLVDQFDAYCPFDEGKTCVNGKLTLGENIGDLGGLSLAYRAYRLSLGGEEAPVIEGFTGDQRFFMSWAQIWRGKAREELARQYLVTDSHSPPEYRVNGIVRNFEQWYRAFSVSDDDALYLDPAKRVLIW